jgi:uncharacterized membrane protein
VPGGARGSPFHEDCTNGIFSIMFRNSLRSIRNYFIGGLFIVVPIGATVYVVWGIFNLLDQWLRESKFLQDRLAAFGMPSNFTFYGIGFATTVVLIIIVGFLGRLYVGRKTLSLVELILSRIPGVSWIYNLIKQISFAFFGQDRTVFDRPVLIEYPRKGIFSLAFAVCPDKGVASRTVGRKLTCVFLATTPNPTSGVFLLVPEEEVIPVDLTVEEAIKMVISSGMVTPGTEPAAQEKKDTIDKPHAAETISHRAAL